MRKFLILFMFLSACGDVSLIKSEVAKSDIDAIKKQLEDANANMLILQEQNEQLRQQLQACFLGS